MTREDELRAELAQIAQDSEPATITKSDWAQIKVDLKWLARNLLYLGAYPNEGNGGSIGFLALDAITDRLTKLETMINGMNDQAETTIHHADSSKTVSHALGGEIRGSNTIYETIPATNKPVQALIDEILDENKMLTETNYSLHHDIEMLNDKIATILSRVSGLEPLLNDPEKLRGARWTRDDDHKATMEKMADRSAKGFEEKIKALHDENKTLKEIERLIHHDNVMLHKKIEADRQHHDARVAELEAKLADLTQRYCRVASDLMNSKGTPKSRVLCLERELAEARAGDGGQS